MIIEPKVKGFICTTAHPTGCAENVRQQIAYVKSRGKIEGPRRVLVLGSSTGYGLSSRITAAFGCGADTLGVYFEREAKGTRTASAGWYNNRAFEQMARAEGLVAEGINGDAYSHEVKAEAIRRIRESMPGGQIDLVVYSLAAPKRTDPETGEVAGSVIKPVGEPFSGKSVNVHTGEVTRVEIQPAGDQEIRDTVLVMGGLDWRLWMEALGDAGVLAPGAATVAYSYIGPALTHAIYRDGTIGLAKLDLEEKAAQIDKLLAPLGGKAFVSVNKALVTQASAAIPVVPLYISLLFKLMKERGTHEGCIEQMVRLFHDRLYREGAGAGWAGVPVDEAGRIRLDDREMDPALQREIETLWNSVETENVAGMADLDGYRADFYRLFGFRVDGVDYGADVAVD